MEPVIAQTHLIVTDVQDEYYIDWCGKIADTKPRFQNGKPIFVIVGSKGSNGRMELNTLDIKYVEKCAKSMTIPRGRGAVTSDSTRIFIKEKNGKEKLIGVVTHNRVKSFAPMYDMVGYEE